MEVAILGGGIAGLATAIALKQAGISARVFERRASVHNLGAGIVCWPNASFVLSELGILAELRGVAGAVTAMRRISSDGTELGSLDITRLDSVMGFPSLSVLREDLMRILLRRAEAYEIPIIFDANAITIDCVGRRCSVRFANGASVSPDIIVGADGRMNSIVRKYVTGDNRPVFQGFVNWIGIHRWEIAAFDRMEIRDYWGVGARFGIVPVSANTAYWAGGVAVTGSQRDDDAGHISNLQCAFRDWPSPIGDIVSNASDSNTKRLPLYDHDPLFVWHKNNVLLIGDAAHAALPTSGQGAAQALEDAWCLARELAASPDNPETAMTEFTQKRTKKTTGIILGGRTFATALFNKDSDACALRDRRALQADYAAMATGIATDWSAGLPISR